jgi:hypothetical protein
LGKALIYTSVQVLDSQRQRELYGDVTAADRVNSDTRGGTGK